MTSKEFLATFTQAWNDHDVDKLMEHMDSDCAFYASVGFDEEGTKCVGWDEVKKGFASLWEGYPDAKFEPVGEDFLVAIEVVANGFLREQGKVTGKKCEHVGVMFTHSGMAK